MHVDRGPKLFVVPSGSVPDSSAEEMPTRDVALGTLLFALAVALGVREGGFWPSAARIAAVASLVLLAVATASAPRDRRGALLIGSLLLLALWWLLRSAIAGSVAAFLPLGASILAFAAAFSVVRPLRARARETAALAVACLGAAGALTGFAGLVWRWFPMAMPSQGLWRLSTTLTYADAAGVVLAVCLLVALGTDVHPLLVRVSVCLCAGGLLAAQSRGAYLAFLCACPLVPWRRCARNLVPLLCGAVLGAAAIASSPRPGAVPWLAVVLVASVGLSAAVSGEVRLAGRGPRTGLAGGAAVLGGIILVALFLHHEIGVRAFAPSNQDRAAEWSAALHQWVSNPVFGVGPDRALIFHAADGSLAHFVHNEYLQIAADAGMVGLALLALTAVALVRSIRRADVLSSCAVAACVCWAIAGGLDFDWHLPVVGLLGGWCAALAAGGGAQAPSAASAGSGSSAITRSATVCGSQPARDATRRRRSPT